jgi:N-acetyl-anhydromuramyl-L-alanine amidase AmpD
MLIKRWIPSPFFYARPTNCPLDMIVIHHIGSKDGSLYSVDGAVAWFTNEKIHVNPKTGKIENKVSAHYIIPRDTYDVQTDMIALVKEEDVALHAGESSWKVDGVVRTRINNYSVGIELEGDGNLVEYTDFQYERLAELVRELCEKHGIKENNIVGHEDVAPDRKVDPGRMFDWKRLRTDIAPKVQVVVTKPARLPTGDFYMGSGETAPRGFFSKIARLFGR